MRRLREEGSGVTRIQLKLKERNMFENEQNAKAEREKTLVDVLDRLRQTEKMLHELSELSGELKDRLCGECPTTVASGQLEKRSPNGLVGELNSQANVLLPLVGQIIDNLIKTRTVVGDFSGPTKFNAGWLLENSESISGARDSGV